MVNNVQDSFPSNNSRLFNSTFRKTKFSVEINNSAWEKISKIFTNFIINYKARKVERAAYQATPVRHEILVKSTFPTTEAQKKEACRAFKKGDVIVTHLTGRHKIERVDPMIKMLQQMSKFLKRAHADADTTIVHVSIVVGVDEEKGRVIISEAMPSKKSGLRTVDLFEHQSCLLTENIGYKYQILRPTPDYKETAEKAAAFAESLAPKASYLESTVEAAGQEANASSNRQRKPLHKFSFSLALKGMYKKYNSFGFNAQKRLFKTLFDDYAQMNVLSGGNKAPRKMFCSAFTSQVFQKAAAEKAWNALLETHVELKDELEALKESVKGEFLPNADKNISQWARKMAEQYGQEMADNMDKFKIDFKFTTPQNFVKYLINENIAKPVQEIVPPTS